MIPAEYSVPVQGKWAGYFHSKSWVIEVHRTRWLRILIMLWIIKGLLYFPLSSFPYSSSPHQQINAECLGICPVQTLAHFIFSLETSCSSSFEPVGFDHLIAIVWGLNHAWDSANLVLLEPQHSPRLVCHVLYHSSCPQPAPLELTLSVFRCHVGIS